MGFDLKVINLVCYPIFVTQYFLLNIWYPIYDSRYLILYIWYLIFDTWYLKPDIWDKTLIALVFKFNEESLGENKKGFFDVKLRPLL